jgi:hypothetical protein
MNTWFLVAAFCMGAAITHSEFRYGMALVAMAILALFLGTVNP